MSEILTRKENGGGRAKLTAARMAAVLDATRKGHSRRFAAGRAGISKVTLFAWLHEGADALQRRDNEEPLDARDEALAEFVIAYENALADRAEPLLEELRTTEAHARVTAGTYLLTLLSPADYSPKQSHEVTGREGGPIEHKVTTDDLFARIEALAAEAAGVDDTDGTRADDRKAE